MKVDLNEDDTTRITELIDEKIESVITEADGDGEQRRVQLAELFRTREKIAPPAATPAKKSNKASGRSASKRGLPGNGSEDAREVEA
jgi:hypothetical protein